MPVADSPQRPATRALPVWLWRAYLRGALWPLLIIELLLFVLAAVIGHMASQALDAAWEARVREALALQAELEARALAQRLGSIAETAALLAERATPAEAADADRRLGRLLAREPALAGLQLLEEGAAPRLLTAATEPPAAPAVWRMQSGDGAPVAETRIPLPEAGRELRLRVRLETLLAAGAWPAEVWLVAADGQVLARLRDEARLRDVLPPEVVQLASGTLRAPSDRLFAWSPVGTGGWRLVLRQPLDAISAPSTLLLPGIWLLAGLAGSFLLLFWQLRRRARRISGQMVRPLRAIEGLVRRIGRGDYTPPPPKLALLELQDTADAVLEMGRRLGEANCLLVEQGRDLRRQAGFRQLLIDSVPVPLFYTDAGGRLLGGNLAFRAFVGTRSDGGEAMARRLLQALPEAAPGLPAAAETLFDDGLDGPRHLLVSGAGFSGVGEADGGQVGVILDLTERRRSERELEAARDRALAASRQKSDFLASVSHEIRTPMNGVIGMTELLLHTGLSAEQHDYARTILGSAQALLQLLNDILDFSKIEAGQITLAADPFDPATLVEGAAELLAARAWEKRIVLATRVDPRLPVPLYGDAGRVRQVLLNLIGNAVKFTDAGEVIVAAEALSHDGRQALVRFSVTDTGLGIPDSARPRMFRPFSQLEGQGERRYAGTGLGLSICKRLCELMGGDISFDSEPGRGSVFRVTLPFRRTGELALLEAGTGPVPAGSTALPVLPPAGVLLDGLPAGAHAALAGTLRAFGLSVYDDQGIEAMAPALRLVLCGAAPEALRAQAAYPSLPAVLLATRDEAGLAARAEAQGWSAVLALPLRRAALHETLGALLYGRSGSGTAPNGTLPARAAVVPRGATLLLAEDDRTNQRVASAHLRKLGFAVEVVGDGDAAVKAATGRHYPLILMDVQMPVMDGLQAAAAIRRAQAGGPASIIVALTANAMSGDRERFLAAGMDDYLSKPFTGDALRRLLERWLPPEGEG